MMGSLGTQPGPPISVQGNPLSWRMRNGRAESGRCAGQSRPKPRGGTIAWSSVRLEVADRVQRLGGGAVL
jgi:hypothetical protein